MEWVEGRTLRQALGTGPLPIREALPDRPADRRRPRRGARQGHRPPRPQARERHDHRGRPRQDPRLRPGAADRRRGTGGRCSRRPTRWRHRRARRPSRARSSERSATCPPSRPRAGRWTSAPTSSRFGLIVYEMLTRPTRLRPRRHAVETLAAVIRDEPVPLVVAAHRDPAASRARDRHAASPSARRIASPPRAISPRRSTRWRPGSRRPRARPPAASDVAAAPGRARRPWRSRRARPRRRRRSSLALAVARLAPVLRLARRPSTRWPCCRSRTRARTRRGVPRRRAHREPDRADVARAAR